MKHSKQVPLILLGAFTALTGCGKTDDLPTTAKQDTYASVDDCRKDWGSGNWCNSTSSGHGGGAVYAGPRYYWDRGLGQPMIIENGEARPATDGEASRGGPAHATGSESVAVVRGGFGATAHGGEGGGHGGGGGESGGG
ncbi:hypothetical protein [Massilia sp. Root335]|uniref:hypothetical protein n=1 Tax=Massilia sp. Root335 TaxID=1736517 RepID=UPI0006F92EAB|nr:hypothetical protein [Massilia sp. Root335]KQV46365.1 hypothetical protein ASC93_14640 [Massilia sp. Root335]